MQETCEAFVKEETLSDKSIQKESSVENLKRFLIKIQQERIDEIQAKVQFLNELGIKVNPNKETGKNLLAQIDSAKSITATIQHIKVDENDNKFILTPEECKTEMQKERITPKALTRASASIEKPSENGYMRQVILVIYDNTTLGKYNIVTQHEWLITPMTRDRDAFSIASPDLRWANINSGAYSRVLSYHLSGTFTEDVWDEQVADPDEIKPDGVYYIWRLPMNASDNYFTFTYSQMFVQMYATGYVHDPTNREQYISVYSQYAHNQLGITTSFGWSSGSAPGVTVNGAIIKMNYFHHYTWRHGDIYK